MSASQAVLNNPQQDSNFNNKNPKFLCKVCNKTFQWKSGLSRHFKLFHLRNQDKNFKCDICNKLFYKQVGLSMHLKKHKRNIDSTNRLDLRKTGIIHAQSAAEDLKGTQKISHLYANVVSETIYSSDSDCEYEILQTVTKLKNPDAKAQHQCEFCVKNFVKLNSLQRHVERHTKENGINKNTNDEELCNLNTVVVVNDKTYSCNKCNKTFKLARNLTNHLKIHLKQSVLMRRELSANSITRTKHRYSCSICNKIYFQKMHLDNHLAIHGGNDEGEEKESCSECNKVFGKKAMEIHKQTHTLVKPYLCMVCGKRYSRSGYLSAHMRTHSNYRPHLCSICGKSFTIRRYLVMHSRTHNQERPFKCQHCSKGFIQKSNLIEHLRIHSGVKPHICSTCGKQFTHYTGLTQHLLTHNPVKKHICRICGKAFRQGGHYREHLRIHSGHKPFVCNICDRPFASSSSLVVHSRTHSGERPFKCPVCKKGFIKSYGLKQHKKTHTACNVP